MDTTKATGMLNGATSKINSITGTVGDWAATIFTIRNIFFGVIIIGIIFVCYMLYKQETMAKRYYFKRNREV